MRVSPSRARVLSRAEDSQWGGYVEASLCGHGAIRIATLAETAVIDLVKHRPANPILKSEMYARDNHARAGSEMTHMRGNNPG